MPFTGKSTYAAGGNLPEIAEDVSDLIGINSPHETPLLDALGDSARSARSTVHEWLEDKLLPDTDAAVSASGADIVVENISAFRVGDQVRIETTGEVALAIAVDPITSTVTFLRGYGGSVTGA